MIGRISRLMFLVLTGFVLTGCSVARVDSTLPLRSVQMPVNTPIVSVEKVVTMVPQVGVSAGAITPSASPTPPGFSDFGLTGIQYADPVSGISLEYPGGWQLFDLTPEQKQSSTMYSITLRSPMPTALPRQQEGPLPAGASAVDIGIWKGVAKSYEEAVALRLKQNRESESPVKIANIQEISLSGGVKATRLDLFTQNGRVTEVVTYITGGMLLIDASGDQSLFDTILATLKVP